LLNTERKRMSEHIEKLIKDREYREYQSALTVRADILFKEMSGEEVNQEHKARCSEIIREYIRKHYA